jgi:hypothetical protein
VWEQSAYFGFNSILLLALLYAAALFSSGALGAVASWSCAGSLVWCF